MNKRSFGYVGVVLLVAGLVVTYVIMNKPDRSADPVPRPNKPVKVFWADGTELNTADPADNAVWSQARRELAVAGFEDEMLGDGYAVELTIDPKAQRAASRILKETLAGQPENLRTALVAVDPKTGRVIAHSGYRERQPKPHTTTSEPTPDNQAPKSDGDLAGSWQNPGDAFSPFVLVGLLKKGKGPAETYDGRNGRVFGGVKIDNPPGVDCGEQCTVATAMKDSVRVVFADIAFNELGLRSVAQAAVDSGMPEKIGAKGALLEGDGENPLDLNIAVGGGRYVTRPLDMAGAYATFAADGAKHAPHVVAKMRRLNDNSAINDGELVYDGDQTAARKPAFDTDESKSAKIARTVTGTLLTAGVPCADNRPCASKAGLHNCSRRDPADGSNPGAITTRTDSCATWMVGYTPQLSTAVWVGSDDKSALKNKDGKALGGKDLAGAAWQAFMNDYLTGKPVEQFPSS